MINAPVMGRFFLYLFRDVDFCARRGLCFYGVLDIEPEISALLGACNVPVIVFEPGSWVVSSVIVCTS